ncbi:MAG TPA: CPBP family intramembrane glutamic endopeptidase, partial [Myxococcota bacterium]|nr:CPBP family intramembrane glutamic endopeptidase [Myxococcota bacterium]
YNPAEAANKLNELLRRQARPTAEVLAYLALAQLLAGDATGAQQTGVRALQAGPKDAMAHAAMARITEATGTGNGAFHRKQALGLAQNNTAWYAEVNAALAVTASDASAQARAQAGAREGLAIGLWVCTAFVLLGLFSLANVFRYGQHEYLYSGKDWLFFARRGVLAVTGLVGWCLWVGKGPVGAARELTWRLGSTQAWWIVVYGLFVGLLSPAQRVTGTWSVVLGLSVLHVLSEELFFRAFLTRMLLDQIDEARLARLVSASLYGLYHVTYFSFWQETGLQARTFYMGAIALLAGLPYAWLYGRNRSLTAPLLCHAAVSLAMMGRSILLRGWL